MLGFVTRWFSTTYTERTPTGSQRRKSLGISDLRGKTLKESDVGGGRRDAIAAARLRVGNQRLECGARLGGKLGRRDAGLCENFTDFIHGGGGGVGHVFKILDFERNASFILQNFPSCCFVFADNTELAARYPISGDNVRMGFNAARFDCVNDVAAITV